MSSILSGIEGVATEAVAGGVGFALGIAAAPALAPVTTDLEQTAFSTAPVKALGLTDAASIVAQEIKDASWGETEASYGGVNTERFDLLHQYHLRAPAVGELLQMIRRGTASSDLTAHALRKAQLETQWDGLVTQLAKEPLGVEAVATMIQRSILPNPGILPFTADIAGSNVPPMPQVDLDPVEQAAWWGLDKDQLSALARIVGLPAAPDLAARMTYRGIINVPAFNLAVAEGNTRNEWAPFLLDGFREILTSGQYAELQLRGFLTAEKRRAGTAKHGMSDGDSDLLFDVMGRAPAVHTITKGLAFGGTYKAGSDGIPEVYLSALQRGNLRPEYYDIAYHDRFLWPSAFVLRALVQGGDLSADDGEQVLLYGGWEPSLAKKVATRWGAGVTATADKHLVKAETQVWSKLHTAYVNRLTTKAEATTDLATIGVTAAAIPQVLALWDVESAIERRSLSPAELKKAAKDGLMTAQAATQRLLALGYSDADAGVILSE